jgi:hypothetical protein
MRRLGFDLEGGHVLARRVRRYSRLNWDGLS